MAYGSMRLIKAFIDEILMFPKKHISRNRNICVKYHEEQAVETIVE
jgi:hypothetical protein